MRIFLISLCWLLFNAPLSAQLTEADSGKIAERIERNYRYYGEDSLLQYLKIQRFDLQGRRMFHRERHYNGRARVLQRSFYFKYDSIEQHSTEINVTYKNDGSEQSQTIKTDYLHYARLKEDQIKGAIKWYDDYGDLQKEDTVRLDDQGRVVERCTYDYTGHTGLFCNTYRFNRFGKVKRWRMYSKWTTINGRSNVVYRQAKRRDYRYCYNGKGQHKRTRGKYYSTRYREKKQYDAQDRLAEVEVLEVTTRKATDRERKNGSKRRIRRSKRELQRFEEGKVVLEARYLDEEELLRAEAQYDEKGKLLERKNYRKGRLISEISWSYHANGQRKKRVEQKYDNNNNKSYRIEIRYNKKGQPLAELQRVSGSTNLASRMIYRYNEQGDIERRAFYRHQKLYEETLFEYRYH